MDDTSTPGPGPRSRAERQQETRRALVMAALIAFTRDGYHGANLEAIASDAGYSKGAVYSNFDGKAELFLAVMDRNLESLQGEDWDPFDPMPIDADPLHPVAERDERTEMLRGFGLATLEFIATAARDDQLSAELGKRMQVLVDAYGRGATRGRADDEVLSVDEVATLLTALDQGVTILVISGLASIDGALLRTGLRRLLDPARAAAEPPLVREDGPPAVHDRELQRRVLRGAPGDR